MDRCTGFKSATAGSSPRQSRPKTLPGDTAMVCKLLHDRRYAALLRGLMPDRATQLSLSKAADNVAAAAIGSVPPSRSSKDRAGSGDDVAQAGENTQEAGHDGHGAAVPAPLDAGRRPMLPDQRPHACEAAEPEDIGTRRRQPVTAPVRPRIPG